MTAYQEGACEDQQSFRDRRGHLVVARSSAPHSERCRFNKRFLPLHLKIQAIVRLYVYNRCAYIVLVYEVNLRGTDFIMNQRESQVGFDDAVCRQQVLHFLQLFFAFLV